MKPAGNIVFGAKQLCLIAPRDSCICSVMADQLQPPFEFHPTCHVYVSDKKAKVGIPERMKQYENGISERF